eukprot:1089480-Prymnesium_polylepis.1
MRRLYQRCAGREYRRRWVGAAVAPHALPPLPLPYQPICALARPHSVEWGVHSHLRLGQDDTLAVAIHRERHALRALVVALHEELRHDAIDPLVVHIQPARRVGNVRSLQPTRGHRWPRETTRAAASRACLSRANAAGHSP